jgi:GH43 family beta-xylosidase
VVAQHVDEPLPDEPRGAENAYTSLHPVSTLTSRDLVAQRRSHHTGAAARAIAAACRAPPEGWDMFVDSRARGSRNSCDRQGAKVASLHPMREIETIYARSYVNPVYSGSFPDPFVLRHAGEYWAYCTGTWSDGRAFGILRSHDLVEWREVGSAMEPLADRPPYYWAPEVSYDNGRFLLYYSAGDEVHMHLRVAAADHPAGPFVDTGRRLTTEQFAIDAHVFVDASGDRYMFYATDFLEHTHIGTGTVVDRMLDAFTLEGRPRPVTRARYDWQVYDPHRVEKGGVRWHTVEGPFVLERKGIYYEMFSGGNWQNVSYGVSYATSDRLLADDEWQQTCDGERIVPILRTIPERVVGPGHNSVVVGPDGRQLFCVYHRWVEVRRALAIDRLEWVGERLTVLGATNEPTAAPICPASVGFASADAPRSLGAAWFVVEGRWSLDDGRLSTEGVARIVRECGTESFSVETSVRWRAEAPPRGAVGLELVAGETVAFAAILDREAGALVLRSGARDERVALGDDFAFGAFRAIRIDVDGLFAQVSLDGRVRWRGRLERAPHGVGVGVDGAACELEGFTLVRGWEDDFADDRTPDERGWRDPADGWRVSDGELLAHSPPSRATLSKSVDVADYELVVNLRRLDGGGYAIAPALADDGSGPVFRLELRDDAWMLAYGERAGGDSLGDAFALGAAFDPDVYQQFRFRKVGGEVEVALEKERLGAVRAPVACQSVAVEAVGGGGAVDLVRLTEIAYGGEVRS